MCRMGWGRRRGRLGICAGLLKTVDPQVPGSTPSRGAITAEETSTTGSLAKETAIVKSSGFRRTRREKPALALLM